MDKVDIVVIGAGVVGLAIGAAIADKDKEMYRLHWIKGDYFSLTGKPPALMLIYLPPPQDTASLGIHSVPDLTGRLRFGPNAFYVEEINYAVESDKEPFRRDIGQYFPSVKMENLHPDI